MKKTLWIALALLCVCTLAATAQEQQQMTPEQQKQMEAWMKAMTPGASHKMLADFEGSWNLKVTMWEAPGAPAQTSDGSSEVKWILGGRTLEEHLTGSMMGMPFEGLGHSGYDNLKKVYWASWIDSMSTGLMTSTGQTGDAGKTFTYTGKGIDPMTGKEQTYEQKVFVQSHDKHSFEMYGPGPNGKKFKMMEIVYTRK